MFFFFVENITNFYIITSTYHVAKHVWHANQLALARSSLKLLS